jgi:hypothetical protein
MLAESLAVTADPAAAQLAAALKEVRDAAETATPADGLGRKLFIRNSLVTRANAMFRDKSGSMAVIDGFCAEAAMLEDEIDAAPKSDAASLATQMILAVRRYEEGLDTTTHLHELVECLHSILDTQRIKSVEAAVEAIRAVDRASLQGLAAKADEDAAFADLDAAERKVWADAVAAYEAARAAYDAHKAAGDALYDELVTLAPDWLKVALPRGRTVLHAEGIKRFDIITTDRTGGPPQHPELLERRPEFLAWLEKHAEKIAAHLSHDEDDEPSNTLLDAQNDAELALMWTPAPDLDAVVYKQRLYGEMLDGTLDGKGFEDPIFSAAIRDTRNPEKAWPVLIYDDCQRLAGYTDIRPAFRPRTWLKEFKAAGGTVERPGDTVLDPRITLGGPADNAEVTRLMAEVADPANRAILVRHLWERLG